VEGWQGRSLHRHRACSVQPLALLAHVRQLFPSRSSGSAVFRSPGAWRRGEGDVLVEGGWSCVSATCLFCLSCQVPRCPSGSCSRTAERQCLFGERRDQDQRAGLVFKFGLAVPGPDRFRKREMPKNRFRRLRSNGEPFPIRLSKGAPVVFAAEPAR
jgi:hypothetical protein